MHKRAAEGRDREEAQLQPLEAGWWRGVAHDEPTGGIPNNQTMRVQPSQMKRRMRSTLQRCCFDQVIDMRFRALWFAPKEVQEHGEGGPPENRKHLHKPMGRKIRVHGALKCVRRDLTTHDLDDDGIDAPEVFDVVHDEPLADEVIQPADDPPVRDPQHPCEIVDAQCEESGALAQRLREKEQKCFIASHSTNDHEKRREIRAHRRETLGRFRMGREKPQARRVLERVVRPRMGTAPRWLRREEFHWKSGRKGHRD